MVPSNYTTAELYVTGLEKERAYVLWLLPVCGDTGRFPEFITRLDLRTREEIEGHIDLHTEVILGSNSVAIRTNISETARIFVLLLESGSPVPSYEVIRFMGLSSYSGQRFYNLSSNQSGIWVEDLYGNVLLPNLTVFRGEKIIFSSSNNGSTGLPLMLLDVPGGSIYETGVSYYINSVSVSSLSYRLVLSSGTYNSAQV